MKDIQREEPEDEKIATEETKMVTVVGVRFKPAGKIYYFDPGELIFETGDYVIVETARGLEYGEIATPNGEVSKKSVVQPLKKVLQTNRMRSGTGKISERSRAPSKSVRRKSMPGAWR